MVSQSLNEKGKYEDKIEEMCEAYNNSSTGIKYSSSTFLKNKFIEVCEQLDKALTVEDITIEERHKSKIKLLTKIEEKYGCSGICRTRSSFFLSNQEGSPNGTCEDDLINYITGTLR